MDMVPNEQFMSINSKGKHMSSPTDAVKHFVDYVAAGISVAALMQWVPMITAVLSLLWIISRWYDLAKMEDTPTAKLIRKIFRIKKASEDV